MASYDLTGSLDASNTTSTAFTPRYIGHNVITSRAVELKGRTAGDKWDLFDLPAGHTVHSVKILVLEDAGETCTISVGNAVSAAGYCAAGDGTINTTASQVIVGTGAWNGSTSAGSEVITASAVGGSTYAAGKFVVVATVVA